MKAKHPQISVYLRSLAVQNSFNSNFWFIVTYPKNAVEFTDELKRECCLMISMGCDRETACNYLGKTAAELRAELQRDGAFCRQLLRAEATPEFSHMRNLYNAARDEKNWRASVWWLERRAPERYAKRAPESITAAQLRQVIEELTEAIGSEVNDPQDRRRVLARLVQIAERLRSDSFEPPTGTVQTTMFALEHDSGNSFEEQV